MTVKSLIWVCSWCVEEGRSTAPPDDRRTDGICAEHKRQLLFRHIAIPRLQSVIARLQGGNYLGDTIRYELAADLKRVICLLEGE